MWSLGEFGDLGLSAGEEIIVPDHVSEIWVPTFVNDVAMSLLLDTGTSHTILTLDAYLLLPSNARTGLEPAGITLKQAAGSSVKVWGRATVDVRVGNRTQTVSVVVGQVLSSMLGMDFLEKTDAKLNFRSLQLEWDNCVVQCAPTPEAVFSPTAPTVPHCRVVAVTDTKIPAGHVAVVTAVVRGQRGSGQFGLVEPLDRGPLLTKGVLVARSVVRDLGSVIPISVTNVGDRPCDVRQGTTLAKMVPIGGGEICETRRVAAEPVVAGERGLPDYLKEMAERSTADMEGDDKDKVVDLLVKYQDVFSSSEFDIGRTTWVKHSIETGEAPPIRQCLRRSSPEQREEVERQVQELLAKGLIQPSDSPWASPVVLVTKKDGSKRLCLDYRKVNEVSRHDAYPLPRIDDSLDALGNAKYFSTLDMASGYWQVEMDKDARSKSAFVTHSGLYEWNVLPFGLCNAPSTFERLMERVLAGLRWETLLVYLDDVIVFGNTVAESVARLEAVLIRFRSAGLKLKPSKCNLFRKQVSYLGHVVSSEGIHTDPSKIEAVKDWRAPRTPKQVRSFLGLASYYRRFIRGFAEIAAPLHRLTEKMTRFEWTDECDGAFEQLKAALVSAPILSYPRAAGKYILDTDASAFAIGAVLSQEQEGEEKVIAYGSKALTKPERNYCVTRRELLAIVVFLKKYRHYVGGSQVRVRTDHGSLRWLCNFKNPEGQLARWLEVLSTFDIELEYRQGRRHQNADGLSRIPCRQCDRMAQGESKVEGDVLESGVESCSNMVEVGCQTGESQMQDGGEAGQSVVARVVCEEPCEDSNGAEGRHDEATEGAEARDSEPQLWLDVCKEFNREMWTEEGESESLAATSQTESDFVVDIIESQEIYAAVASPDDDVQSTGFEPSMEADWQSDEASSSPPLVVFTQSVTVEPEFSFELVREAQLKDDTVAPILKAKEKGEEKPKWAEVSGLAAPIKTYWNQWELLTVKKGVLVKRWESNDSKVVKWLIVLPRCLRNRVMDELHSSRRRAHKRSTGHHCSSIGSEHH